ncbi:MAG: thymidine phosphorylase family protein, partial [Thermoanaerobaculaceae bacterium]|nr:thymidine phosphorylase family protein [Thermoanaerobaculaceae bacterium]
MKIRMVKIDTFRENVIFLRKDSEFCRAQTFSPQTKVELSWNGKTLVGLLNTIDEPFLAKGEVGLCEYAFEKFGLPAGTDVKIRHMDPVKSVDLVRKKIHGEILDEEDYLQIVKDIVENRYSKVELTAFVVACAHGPMEREEVVHLAKAMVETGDVIKWDSEMIVDKHCIGGIPGNRTTMVVVPIVAAYGLLIPKTSSRSITSPAGTADTMDALADVHLDLKKMKEIVSKENGCLGWGGAFTLAPADDIIIAVERPLSIDAQGQMIASILSKKKAAGATHILIDIPVGKSAKVTSPLYANQLKKLFEYVSAKMDMFVDVIITDGSEPIGRGIGPVLEAIDVLKVLKNEKDAPKDLWDKSVELAGRILEFDPKVRGGEGRKIAEEILLSGKAYEKMERIIEAQGRRTLKEPGPLKREIVAYKNGRINEINNQKIAKCAKLAGAPEDAGAGVYLLKRVGEKV